MRSAWMGLMIAAALAIVGCNGGGVGSDCVSRCEQGKTGGCVTAGTDCSTSCRDAETAEQTARNNASTAGCLSQHEAAIACAETLEPCESGCNTENEAYASCLVTFCMANPTSPACSG